MYVKTNSHRARERLAQRVGPLDMHYTWEHGGVFALVPDDADLSGIPGLTVPRKQDGYRKCWGMSG